MRSSAHWKLHGGKIRTERESGALGMRCNRISVPWSRSLYTGPKHTQLIHFVTYGKDLYSSEENAVIHAHFNSICSGGKKNTFFSI